MTWCNAPFDAMYGSSPGMGPRCWPEVMSTTRPGPGQRAANSLTSSSVARVLTA